MALVTYNGHTNRAKAWFDQSDVYFVVGGQTPWPDDDNPPLETEDETITDPLGYRHYETKAYVVPDPAGTIVYRGMTFRMISPDDIFTERCRWVYMTGELNYDSFPLGTYRKIGIVTGLTKLPGTSDDYTVLPENVADPGILECVANDSPTTRSVNKREKLAILVEF